MFFAVSKVFWVMAQPISMAILLVAIGIALVAWHRRRSGIAALSCGCAVLVLASYTTLGAMMMAPLENRFQRPQHMPASVSAIIMLGGATLGRISAARGTSELNEAADRLTETLWLAQQYPEAKIVLSGGVGLLVPSGEPEAVTAERFFARLGIAQDRLVLESQSRNTAENAEFSRQLLEGEAGSIMLVTSAFHMPRSVGLFRKTGVEVVPWPTDYRSTGEESFAIDIANPMLNLENMTIALREWIGLAAYKLTARIDDWFPG